jgi:hypothetical protein
VGTVGFCGSDHCPIWLKLRRPDDVAETAAAAAEPAVAETAAPAAETATTADGAHDDGLRYIRDNTP